jgi:hypothetical protein
MRITVGNSNMREVFSQQYELCIVSCLRSNAEKYVMKKNTIVLIIFVGALSLFSTRAFSQQDSMRMPSKSEQLNNQKAQDAAKIDNLKDDRDAARVVAKDAQETERDAQDASKQSKSALKAEKKAQKSRKNADKQIEKAEKAKIESDKNH